jgi:hypothetical protein
MDVSSDLEIVLAYLSDSTTASQVAFSLDLTFSSISTGQIMTTVAGTVPTFQQSLTVSYTPDAANGMALIQRHVQMGFIGGNNRARYNVDTDLIFLQLTRNADANPNGMIVMAMDLRYTAFIDGNPIV